MKPLSKIYTNTHYPISIIYKDTDGAPINVAGSSATFALRRSLFSDPVISTNATIDGVNGGITFNVDPTHTANLLGEKDSEKFLCGAVLTLANGTKVNLFQTTVDVVQNVVRP